MNLKPVNIFVDMDGVLAVYHPDTEKHMYNKGFFLNRPSHEHMVKAVRSLIVNSEYNVFILSSIINSLYCKKEKELWLEERVPELDRRNAFFVPYGMPKSDFITQYLNLEGYTNILLDDYSKNLNKWDVPNPVPVKVLNGINNKSNSWEGLSIISKEDAETIFNKIVEITETERRK